MAGPVREERAGASVPLQRVVLPGGASGRFERWRPSLLSEEHRQAVVDALLLRPPATVLWRYTVLLLLSVVVASVGLLQDSTAVVVGAMMIAPLMAPIMGIAASLVMGWGRRLLGSACVVTASVVGAVAVSWAIAKFLPDAGVTLPAEVLARSNPDVRDLLVALAAGAAGAYATVRKDISGALPGVAVAVALVPPLATVGVLLGRGQPDLARGALLLFAANLFAIVLTASVVFVATGLMPPHRLHEVRRGTLIVFGILTVPPLALGVVLTGRFLNEVDQARELRLATQSVVEWLGPRDDLDRVTLDGSTLRVNATGDQASPDLAALTTDLAERLGHPTAIDLRWTVRDKDDEPAATSVPTLDRLQPVVQAWVDQQALTLEGLSYDASALVVRTSGAHPPTGTEELATRIETRFGSRPAISLAWTRGEPVADAETDANTARSVAQAWTSAHPGTAVLGVDHNASAVTVTITGSSPAEMDDLQTELRTAIPDSTVTVLFIAGDVIVHTTPSPTPTGRPSTAPSQPGGTMDIPRPTVVPSST